MDSQVSRPKCTIRIQVKKGSEKGVSEFATVKVTQDDFHECRVYTMDPVKQRQKRRRAGSNVVKIWSSAAGPLEFELEVPEKKAPLQLFGPLTEEQTRKEEQYLKRKRGEEL